MTRRHPKFGTDAYRQWFWSNVDRSSDPNGCWLWLKSKYGKGMIQRAYGNAWRDGYWEKAHRVAWELEICPLPVTRVPLVVMHLCDNGWCVNPDHLALGTEKANMYDAKRKGRLGKTKRQPVAPPPGQPLLVLSPPDGGLEE